MYIRIQFKHNKYKKRHDFKNDAHTWPYTGLSYVSSNANHSAFCTVLCKLWHCDIHHIFFYSYQH